MSTTAILAMFKGWKLWALLAAVLALWYIGNKAYAALENRIETRIEAEIAKRAEEFKNQAVQITTEVVTVRDTEAENILKTQAKTIDSLNRQLKKLEKDLANGLITVEERREQASVARYETLAATFCNAQRDVLECEKYMGVVK